MNITFKEWHDSIKVKIRDAFSAEIAVAWEVIQCIVDSNVWRWRPTEFKWKIYRANFNKSKWFFFKKEYSLDSTIELTEIKKIEDNWFILYEDGSRNKNFNLSSQ